MQGCVGILLHENLSQPPSLLSIPLISDSPTAINILSYFAYPFSNHTLSLPPLTLLLMPHLLNHLYTLYCIYCVLFTPVLYLLCTIHPCTVSTVYYTPLYCIYCVLFTPVLYLLCTIYPCTVSTVSYIPLYCIYCVLYTPVLYLLCTIHLCTVSTVY